MIFFYIVDGEWIPWSSWSICGVSCGSGFNERHRYCMPPRQGGLPCNSVNGTSVEHEHKPCYTSVSCPGKLDPYFEGKV